MFFTSKGAVVVSVAAVGVFFVYRMMCGDDEGGKDRDGTSPRRPWRLFGHGHDDTSNSDCGTPPAHSASRYVDRVPHATQILPSPSATPTPPPRMKSLRGQSVEAHARTAENRLAPLPRAYTYEGYNVIRGYVPAPDEGTSSSAMTDGGFGNVSLSPSLYPIIPSAMTSYPLVLHSIDPDFDEVYYDPLSEGDQSDDGMTHLRVESSLASHSRDIQAGVDVVYEDALQTIHEVEREIEVLENDTDNSLEHDEAVIHDSPPTGCLRALCRWLLKFVFGSRRRRD